MLKIVPGTFRLPFFSGYGKQMIGQADDLFVGIQHPDGFHEQCVSLLPFANALCAPVYELGHLSQRERQGYF